MTTMQLGRFTVSLPAITGVSDKQIQFGVKCREEKLQAAAALVIDRPQFKSSPAATQDAFISALVGLAAEHKEARYWIDSDLALSREMAVKASRQALGK